MLSRLGRTGWALVAAGAMGITPVALAEQPTAPALATPSHTAVCPAQQTDALRLELAWLGHPTTFGHSLAAVSAGPGLELRGFVPSEAVREQAVALARLMTDLPIQDRLSVHTGLSARVSGGSLADIQREAALALRDVFGDRVDTVEVAARAGGQVTLRGYVANLEQKVQASRQMRQVRGCTSVANQLIIGVPDRAAFLPPASFKPQDTKPVALVPPTPAPAPAVTRAVMEQPMPASKPAPAPKPAPVHTLPGKPTGQFLGHSPYASVPTPTSAMPPSSPYGVVLGHSSPAPLPTSVTTGKPAPAAQPVPAAKVVPASSPAVSQAPKVVPAIVSVPEPVKLVEPKVSPISVKVPQQGYESKGVLLVVDDELAPPVMSSEPIVPAKLETIIRNLCGGDIRDVKVTPQANKSITVSVELARPEAEKKVVPLLLQLPEMAHLNVRLEVTVP